MTLKLLRPDRPLSLRGHVLVRSPFAVTSREWAVGRRWVLEPCSGAGLGGSGCSPFRWSISGGMSRCCRVPDVSRFPQSATLGAAHARSEAQLARPTSGAAVRELALTRPHAFAPTLRLRATLNTSYALKTEPASQQPSRTKAPSDPSRDAPDEGSETRPASCGATVVGVASTQAEPAGSWSLALNASR